VKKFLLNANQSELYPFSKELSAFFVIVIVTVIGVVYLAEVLQLSNGEAE
jgi:hypothetical protein